MATDSSDLDGMKTDFSKLIDEQLDLTGLQKIFMHKRWLDQLLWMEKSAVKAQRKYHSLRTITIIGGVIVPVLVTLSIDNTCFQTAAIVLGLIVAISAAIEQFFNFGERWRHYRRTAEQLKSEGWKFFQKSGNYDTFNNHNDAYPTFATRIEAYLQQDVEAFINEVAKEKKQSKKDKNSTD